MFFFSNTNTPPPPPPLPCPEKQQQQQNKWADHAVRKDDDAWEVCKLALTECGRAMKRRTPSCEKQSMTDVFPKYLNLFHIENRR